MDISLNICLTVTLSSTHVDNLPLRKRVSNFTLGLIPRYVLRMAIQPNIRHRSALSSYSKRYNLRERCEFAAERCCLSL